MFCYYIGTNRHVEYQCVFFALTYREVLDTLFAGGRQKHSNG